MAKISSKIEEIEGKLYIVEHDETGKIICKSLYEEPIIENLVEIDVETLSEVEFKKLMLEKQGYKVKEIKK